MSSEEKISIQVLVVANIGGTHKPKCIHQILGCESTLQFCNNWLTIFSHCYFIDVTTSSCTYLVTKPNVPIWSTNVAQICYLKNSIPILKFVTQQRVSLSWAKFDRSNGSWKTHHFGNRSGYHNAFDIHLIDNFWILIMKSHTKSQLVGQILSNNGLFPRMA